MTDGRLEVACLFDRRWGGMKGEITKEKEEAFAGDRYLHYLDCKDGFTGVYIRQKLSNCTL